MWIISDRTGSPATGSPNGLKVDSTYVYWTNMGGGLAGTVVPAVVKAPLGGGAAVTLASGSGGFAIAIDSDSAYWTSSDGTVMKVSLEGGTPVTLASGNGGTDIAVDGTSVYWTAQGDFKVMKVALDGSEVPTTLASDLEFPSGIAVDQPVTLASGQKDGYGVAVDANSVYWTSDTQHGTVATGAVMKATPK